MASKDIKDKDIDVIVLEKIKSIDGFATNKLKLKFTGTEVNFILINTLRRIAMSLLGSFAFDPDYINIERNTSIFDNNYMKLRIANTPIINKDYNKMVVKNTEELITKFLEQEINANTSIFEMKKDELQLLAEVEEKKKEMLDNLHMSIEARNRTDQIMEVTTNEQFTTFFVKDKKVGDIYPKEILIIKLKPGEDFICTAIANLNIPMINNIYSSCTIFSYEEISENDFEVVIESQRQISEEDIIKRCCKILILKMSNIRDKLIDKIQQKYDNEYEAEIKIENENHTLGNILTRCLQDHKNMEYCGYKIDHPDINELTIRFKTEGKKFTQILDDVVKKQIKILEKIISSV
jgi:DNA-directed RNA polymerase subunit L